MSDATWTDAEKYGYALHQQNMDRELKAMGPGNYVFVPDLATLPEVSRETAMMMQRDCCALLTFIERLGFKMFEHPDGRFEFVALAAARGLS